MGKKERAVKVKQAVLASPQDVFEAFIHSGSLNEWLCDVSQADARPGGRLYLWWNSGYYASGEFTALEPPRVLEFSWHGRNEPGLTQVRVVIKPQGDGSLVSLTHSGMGEGKAWAKTSKEFKRSWEQVLENLQSVVETGQDLRFVRRPILGVSGLEEINADNAARLGAGAKFGLFIDGVVEGMGAEKAGLRKGDVLVKFGGKKIEKFEALRAALHERSAGDAVKITYWREGEKLSGSLELSGRPLPEIPMSPAALAEWVQKDYARVETDLLAALDGVDEDESDYRRNAEEWNVKEMLAHLIAVERDIHTWIAGLVEGKEAAEIFHSNQPSRLRATTAAFPSADALVEELKRNRVETIATLASLPADLAARKGTFWRLSYMLLTTPEHDSLHHEQIRLVLEEARRVLGALKEPEDGGQFEIAEP